jgi:protein SCO1/2
MSLSSSTWRRLAVPVIITGVLSASAACARQAPEEPVTRYTMTGQVLDVRADIGEVRVKHDPIPGFMDAMTMSFRVNDRALLANLQRGDVVTSTLVVTPSDSWLEAITKTGARPVVAEDEDSGGPPAMVTLLEPGDRVPEIELVDETGSPWTPAALKGRAFALTFFSTRCALPDSCSLLTERLRAAQALVAARPALAGRVRLVMVSFDPEYDTAPVLAAHAKAAGAHPSTWTFLTGDRAAIEAFAARFGVTVLRDPADPANIAHNLRTAVVGPDGTIRGLHSGTTWTPERLVADLEALAR